MGKVIYGAVFGTTLTFSMIAGISAGFGVDISPLGITSLVGNTFFNATTGTPLDTTTQTALGGVDLHKMFSKIVDWAQAIELIVLLTTGLGAVFSGRMVIGSYLYALVGGYSFVYGFMKNTPLVGWIGLGLMVLGAFLAMAASDNPSD